MHHASFVSGALGGGRAEGGGRGVLLESSSTKKKCIVPLMTHRTTIKSHNTIIPCNCGHSSFCTCVQQQLGAANYMDIPQQFEHHSFGVCQIYESVFILK